MRTPISLEKFLEGIRFKPVHVMYDDFDDMYVIDFRSRNKKEPSLEFSNHVNEKGYQHIYFEIIDYDGYKDGTLIGIEDSRRIGVTTTLGESPKDISEYQKEIERKLEILYYEVDRKERS